MTAVKVFGILPLFNEISEIYPKCEKASRIALGEFYLSRDT